MADPNNINSQLSNLKDLDVADLVKILSEYKNSITMFVLVIGALLIGALMFNDHRIKEQFLRAQILQAKEKIETLKDSDTAKQNLKDFKSSLPQNIDEHTLITLISGYAKDCNVAIDSLSPAESKNMGLYDDISITLSGESDNYKYMVLFLRKIEKSKFPLKINSWSGRLGDKEKVMFSMQISAIIIHI